MNAYSKSDKKTYRENLSQFFASADTCIDYVHEPYVKYEERSPDQWNEFIMEAHREGQVSLRVLKMKEDTTVLK